MSVTLLRHAKLQTITVKALTGVDGQGKPAYGTGANISGKVVREKQVVRLANGSEINTSVSAWIDGAQTTLPDTDDRLEFADGTVGIVVERKDVRSVTTDVLDHIRLRLREI